MIQIDALSGDCGSLKGNSALLRTELTILVSAIAQRLHVTPLELLANIKSCFVERPDLTNNLTTIIKEKE